MSADSNDPAPDGGEKAKSNAVGLPMGLIGGVILGALIDNMAFGLIAGLAVGIGMIRIGRGPGTK